ncbi:MAG TPA: hypothetical protein VLW50_17320 [Streptosporangiaceae bacterium]|nr:hypothetical protein [Streptosporangiaceae bacterium]
MRRGSPSAGRPSRKTLEQPPAVAARQFPMAHVFLSRGDIA